MRPAVSRRRRCPACPDGRLELRHSRYGPFVGCADYPVCGYRRGLAAAGGCDGYTGPRDLGTDPASGLAVSLRRGPNGWYVQRGERSDTGGREKPARMSLPGSMAPASVDLDLARRLLALPREVGTHPETGEPILAGIGRYGPWLRHEETYAAIPAGEDVLAIGLNRAVDLIAEKQVRESRARGPKQVLRNLGPHPQRRGGAAVRRWGVTGSTDIFDDAAFRARLTLHLGTDSFDGANATERFVTELTWANSGLTWADMETYAVRLTLSVPGIDSIAFNRRRQRRRLRHRRCRDGDGDLRARR